MAFCSSTILSDKNFEFTPRVQFKKYLTQIQIRAQGARVRVTVGTGNDLDSFPFQVGPKLKEWRERHEFVALRIIEFESERG